MADNISLKLSVDGIGDYFRSMLKRSQLVRGWLNRVAYPIIIKAQRLRWMTQGASEGEGWAPLNPSYARYKLRKFAEFPGSGRKILIATGNLVNSVTGDDRKDHYKLVKENRLEVGTLLSYARFVNEARNFTDLGPDTEHKLATGLRDYILRGR